jgi:hypothetical protein
MIILFENVIEAYKYYDYYNDLLIKLNAKRMYVADVTMPAAYGGEESSINYPTYIRKVSGMLLQNFLWRLKVKYALRKYIVGENLSGGFAAKLNRHGTQREQPSPTTMALHPTQHRLSYHYQQSPSEERIL